eukprot:9691100-Alexandrium_andersonii.AAC.1
MAEPPRLCLPALPHRSSGLRLNRPPGPVGAVPLRTAAASAPPETAPIPAEPEEPKSGHAAADG